MSESRASKIWKRTRVGGALALGLALLLWLASRSATGMPVLVAGAALLAGSLWEIERMGTLAGRRLGWILLLPAIGMVWLAHTALTSPVWDPDVLIPDPPPLRVQLARSYGVVLLLALIGHGLVRTLERFGGFGRYGRGAVVLVYGILTTYLAVTMDEGGRLERLALGAVGTVLLYTSGILKAEDGLRDLGRSVGAALWLVLPLPALILVWNEWGIEGLVALVVLSKIGDIAGYYAGSAIGRSHPFPRISPGKTTAGCMASLVAGAAGGAALVQLGVLASPRLGVAGGLAAGALVNVAAQAGDLLESWVKRRTSVKDSSTLFGPSGGFLDLVDSVLVSVPVALVAWPFMLSEDA